MAAALLDLLQPARPRARRRGAGRSSGATSSTSSTRCGDDGVEFELHRQGMLVAAREPEPGPRGAREAAADARLRLRAARRRARRGRAARGRAGARRRRSTAASSCASTGTCGPTRSPPGSPRRCGAMDVEIVEGAEVNDFLVDNGRVRRRAHRRRRPRGRRLPARRRRLDDAAGEDDRRPLPDAGGQGLQLLRQAERDARSTRSCSPTSTSAARRSASRCGSAGTMEFSGLNTRLDERRIDDIVTAARTCFEPWQTPEIEQRWAGMRPITPDGLPVLDRAGVRQRLRRHRLLDAGGDPRRPGGPGDGRVHDDRAQARAAGAVRDRAPAGAAPKEERTWLSRSGW